MSMVLNDTKPLGPRRTHLGALWQEAWQRERTLMGLSLFMVLALLLATLALGLDDRSYRGVSVWVKPMKFMASLALFSATTAWFVGLLPPARRSTRPVRLMVWTLVISGVLEVGYISLQAALGQASHYNRTDRLHMVLYQAMGVMAVALLSTQLMLAWQIARHGRKDIDPTWRAAVVVGLLTTFALTLAAAAPLSAAQPPPGAGIWLFGWHLSGGDLRPAHFLGLHAQQFVPLAGWALSRAAPQQARTALFFFVIAYSLCWLGAMQIGLRGVLWVPPT